MGKKNLLTSRMQKTVIEDKRNPTVVYTEPDEEFKIIKRGRKDRNGSRGEEAFRSGESTLLSPKQKAQNEKTKKVTNTIGKIAIITLCVYVCFLIFGLLSTNFKSDKAGNIVPEVLSVEEIKTLKQYETLSSYYLRARIIYEETLTIDYNLANHPEKSLEYAMDYTAKLETAEKLIIDLQGAEYDLRYGSFYSGLSTWTNETCQYLQYVSSGIMNNNEADAAAAIEWRSAIFYDFATITSNMAVLADSTKGADNNEIYSWSPESFIQNIGKDK